MLNKLHAVLTVVAILARPTGAQIFSMTEHTEVIAINGNTTAEFIGERGPVWFSFFAEAGHMYSFWTHLGTLSDTIMSLVDRDMSTVLVENDDEFASGGGLHSHFQWTSNETGTYFVVVRGYSFLHNGTFSVEMIDDGHTNGPDRVQAPCEVCDCNGRVHVAANETAPTEFYWLADHGEGEFAYSGPHPAGAVSPTSGWFCAALTQHHLRSNASNDTGIPTELIWDVPPRPHICERFHEEGTRPRCDVRALVASLGFALSEQMSPNATDHLSHAYCACNDVLRHSLASRVTTTTEDRYCHGR